ncbi:VOC family protein [Streptomyces sp. NPDC051452]|uniref:VOC family protein n=1 Tax=Streptomyces sp. NPDC051452 TaxID=3365654 RepID=UPI003796B433
MTTQGSDVLAGARVATRLPAGDLERARRFYAEKLGLRPVDERPGGLLYRCGGTDFVVFRSTGVSSGTFTQMGFEVDDLEAVVAELKRRGVEFEDVDAPGFHTRDGIAEIEGNYPGKGARGERAAWFRDSEGNLLGIGQPTY